jgi:hypothetical protein
MFALLFISHVGTPPSTINGYFYFLSLLLAAKLKIKYSLASRSRELEVALRVLRDGHRASIKK